MKTLSDTRAGTMSATDHEALSRSKRRRVHATLRSPSSRELSPRYLGKASPFNTRSDYIPYMGTLPVVSDATSPLQMEPFTCPG